MGGRPGGRSNGNTARFLGRYLLRRTLGSSGRCGEKKSVVQKRAQDVLVGKIFRRGTQAAAGSTETRRCTLPNVWVRRCDAVPPDGRLRQRACNNGRSPGGEWPRRRGGCERAHTSGGTQASNSELDAIRLSRSWRWRQFMCVLWSRFYVFPSHVKVKS